MIKKKFLSSGLASLGFLLSGAVSAQQVVTPNNQNTASQLQLNTITTAVPFLMISPDSRSGAMGDAGVSTSPDANSIHWNPAKLAFIEDEAGASLTYSPWLRNLVGDISLSYLSGYKRIDKISTIGASLRYFSLGEITFTDVNGNNIGNFTPNEWAFDVAYGMQLSDEFSFGMALRYINSNLTQGLTVNNTDTRPGRSVAADVSAYYQNPDLEVGGYDETLRAGVAITNIGAKMSYTDNDESDFLPTNLRLGPSLELELDDYNTIMFTVEANKLLVPTPPVYMGDSTGQIVYENGEPVIASGKDPDVSVTNGILQSFTDAPGNVTGFDAAGNAIVESGSIRREEFNEVTLSGGMEYWYDKQFAVRMGYFYENPTKGNRQYFTMGLGLKL
ncbi:MAG: type IX secretion system outer membrane channel protein PorV, partial [Vicingaceae bacterium]